MKKILFIGLVLTLLFLSGCISNEFDYKVADKMALDHCDTIKTIEVEKVFMETPTCVIEEDLCCYRYYAGWGLHKCKTAECFPYSDMRVMGRTTEIQ